MERDTRREQDEENYRKHIDSLKKSYENSQSEFKEVSEAYSHFLNISLQYIKIKTKKAKVQADILYFESQS